MQKVPVATIRGTEEPDKFVLVHGHYDSWDVGVGDNATGDATMLELARVLWKHRGGLRRSVKLAWWPGHSTGRYAGSTWFTDAFALDLDRNCLAQINCDSPGCRWATSYHETRSFTECAGIAADAIRDIVPDAVIATRRPPQAGDYSFNNIGLPSFFMLSSTMPNALREEKNYYDVSGCGGNIAWHTENDTLEIADRDILLTDMKIYLLSALRVANAEVLPFDWGATCDEFLQTIASLREGLARTGRPFTGACRHRGTEGRTEPARRRTARVAERGAAGARAHTGADQLHAGAALHPRPGLYGAAAADSRRGGRIAGVRRRPRPTLRHGRSDARTEPLRGGDGHGSAAGRVRCRVTAPVQLR